MYFTNSNSLEDLKREYRRLAMVNHPDHGGDTATMQAINAAYTQAVKHFSRYGNIPKADRRQAADARRTSQAVERAIDAIKNLSGLTIELVGLWVWVSGNTYVHREALNAAGYKWARKKKMWYFAGCESRGRGRPMDEIRETYGSVTINEASKLIA